VCFTAVTYATHLYRLGIAWCSSLVMLHLHRWCIVVLTLASLMPQGPLS
jgi:hypothetical protein